MGTYPNLKIYRPRKAKRVKEKKAQPEETPTPSPVKSDLIATDGKTPITPEVKRRGEMVEIVGGMKLMRDKETKIEWVERLI